MPPPHVEILKRRLKRLSSVPDNFIGRMKAVQVDQYNRIVMLLKRLDLAGDVIDSRSKSNYQLVDKLREDLHDYILRSDYADAVKEFAGEFNKQKKVNEEYYKTISSDFDAIAADEIVNKIQKSTVRNLYIDKLNSDYLAPLEGILNTAISSQAGFDETLRYIRLFVEGNDEVDGSISRYAKQLAHDSFANADRAYGNAVSDELELDFYLWAGGEVPGTRCFCIERHEKYYHWKEIAAWGRGEDVGECGFPWQGMNKATDENTIFVYAGGHNCLHTVAGVSTFDVPREVILRNVENGNYSPSEFERKEFGL